ncbi:paired amphipathic helix protein Sin3-like protein 4 isoform X2 [Tanacetum coccineum]|uniref:Paired amphipathic helix protein Sin3-like protein 4 isoform X2 n=1 Tax=Tanacetum coccineum TaxID=301880 RepID=A0ABQ4XU35_9ASTR
MTTHNVGRRTSATRGGGISEQDGREGERSGDQAGSGRVGQGSGRDSQGGGRDGQESDQVVKEVVNVTERMEVVVESIILRKIRFERKFNSLEDYDHASQKSQLRHSTAVAVYQFQFLWFKSPCDLKPAITIIGPLFPAITIAIVVLSPGKPQAIISKEEVAAAQGHGNGSNKIQQIKPIADASGAAKKGMVLPFTRHEMREQWITENRLKLLRDVTTIFRPRDLTALIGVSGAGKTTLMDVAGLLFQLEFLLESVILKHPGISTIAVVGLPDARLTEMTMNEAEKEFKKMNDQIKETHDAMQTSYKDLISESQASTNRATASHAECKSSVERPEPDHEKRSMTDKEHSRHDEKESDTSGDTELREHHTDDKDCDKTHTKQILDHTLEDSIAELFHQDLHGQMLCLRETMKERLSNSDDYQAFLKCIEQYCTDNITRPQLQVQMNSLS